MKNFSSIYRTKGSKTQIVGRAELLPCLVAQIIWAQRMDGRAVIHHVDNEAERYAVIKGTSPTLDSAFLMAAFWKEDSERRAFSWFERIQSPTKPPMPLPERENLGLCAEGLRTGSNPDRRILVPSFHCVGIFLLGALFLCEHNVSKADVVLGQGKLGITIAKILTMINRHPCAPRPPKMRRLNGPRQPVDINAQRIVVRS